MTRVQYFKMLFLVIFASAVLCSYTTYHHRSTTPPIPTIQSPINVVNHELFPITNHSAYPSFEFSNNPWINQDMMDFANIDWEKSMCCSFIDAVPSYRYKNLLHDPHYSLIQKSNSFEQIDDCSFFMTPNLFSPSLNAWQWGDVLLIISNNRLEIFRLVIPNFPLKEVVIYFSYNANLSASYVLPIPAVVDPKKKVHPCGLEIWSLTGHSFPIMTKKGHLSSWTLRTSRNEAATWSIVFNPPTPILRSSTTPFFLPSFDLPESPNDMISGDFFEDDAEADLLSIESDNDDDDNNFFYLRD